jgi:hypothetical protein
MHPQQVLNSVSIASKCTSIVSSITGVTDSTPAHSHAKKDQKRAVFIYDAKAVSSDIHCLVLPVTIQSIMPHIQQQLGADIHDNSCPSIRCVVDTTAALCTGNNYFVLAFVKRFPQCVAKIYLP